MEENLTIAYYLDEKEVYTDNLGLYIPKKMEVISFKEVPNNLSTWYLRDGVILYVSEVEFSLPKNIKITLNSK